MAINFSAPLPPSRTTGDAGEVADVNLMINVFNELRTAVASLSGSTADVVAPTISAFTATPGNAQVTLNWSASDNVGVAGYVITRGGTQIYTGTGSSYVDTGLTNGTTYAYVLTARDAAGNTKAASTSAAPVASTAATKAYVTINSPVITTTSVTVSWSTTLGTDGVTPDSVSTSRDGVDSTGYGAYTATGDPTTGSRTFNQLVAGSTYNFTVQLVKAGANYGTPVTVSATVPASTGGGTTTPTAVTLATELFTGAANAAWPSQWTVSTTSGGSVQQDGSGRGRFITPATGYTNVSSYLTGIGTASDLDISFDVTFPVIVEEYFSVALRCPSSGTDVPAAGYQVQIFPGNGTNTLGVDLLTSGQQTSLSGDLAAGAWTAGVARRVRFSVVGNNIRVKIWDPATTEPSTWLWAGTDITYASASGKVWMGGASGAAVARTILIDNVKVTDGADLAGASTGGGNTSGGSTTLTPNGPSGSWTLVWHDEFDGTTLDTTRWSKMDGGFMNAVTTRASNISVANSCLVLTLSDANNGAEVSSGPGDGAGANGYLLKVGDYVEASVNFPGSGTTVYNWPAFWASGPNWPSNGEHDIAEILGNRMTCNYHYGPVGTNNQLGPFNIAGTWAGAFHTYGLYRKATTAEVYWDGKLVQTYNTQDNGGGESIIANVGASGTVVSGTASQVKVDYVRVWRPA